MKNRITAASRMLFGIFWGMIILTYISFAAETESKGNAILSVKHDAGTSVVSIDGTVKINSRFYLNDITLQILRPGKTVSDLSEITPDNYDTIVQNMVQVRPNADGTFHFEYPANDVPGVYTVRAVFSNGDTSVKSFLLMANTSANDLLSAINKADDSAKMLEVLNNYPYIWKDLEIYKTVTAAYPNQDILSGVAKSMAGKTYLAQSDVMYSFEWECVTQALNLVVDEKEMAKCIQNYSGILGMDNQGVYTRLYLNFDEQVKLKVCKTVNKEHGDHILFLTDFYDQVILTAMGSTNSWKDIPDILEKARTYLVGFDFKTYDSLTDKQKENVCMKIANSTFSTVKGLQTIFNNAVKDKSVLNPGSNSGPSGPSGGGEKRTGSSSVMNIDQAVLNNIQNKNMAFQDLAGVEWAKESIEYLAGKGIINGKGNNYFCPNDAVTREEFVKMLVGAFGLSGGVSQNVFDDVSENEWFYPYILAAKENNIVQGLGERTFGVGRSITREDLAVMAVRAISRLGKKALNGTADVLFADNDEISGYAAESVYALKNAGIISGRDNNLFQPKAYATRAEATKIIYGLITMMEVSR